MPGVTDDRNPAATEDSTVKVTRADGVVTVTLNRPHRKNAANLRLWNELRDVLFEISRRSDDRVVIITGSGDAFCSGADLNLDDGGTDNIHWMRRMEEVNDVCLALHRLPQPTIARVNGVAAGAGMNLALACDLVVAAEGARFSEIFTRRGLSVDFGGSWILPRLIGMHRAAELVLLAEMIDARRAEAMGLVNRVVPADELDAVVDAWAARLVASPPIAIAASKRLLHHGVDSTLAEALHAEAAAQAINFSTRDTIEAILAFIEKRDPIFEGR